MDDWLLLGPVVRLQIHAREIVYGGEYHIEHLTEVESLWVTDSGAIGVVDGRAIVDYHHRDHPELRRFLPQRQLSIGFTGHYDLMAESFGSAPMGVAAENVIVDYPGTLVESDVSAGLLVESQNGPFEMVGASVAKPCVPFTKFLLGDANESSVAEYRVLLDQGVRGFVMSVVGTPRFMINDGDLVYRKVAGVEPTEPSGR